MSLFAPWSEAGEREGEERGEREEK